MRPPLPQMSKEEILTLWRWRCKHGCDGISHYNCYLREGDIKERIGFFDIEASNLKANFGIILSWAIKPEGKDWVWYDHVTKADMRSDTLDKRVVKSFCDVLSEFDRLCTWFGTRFDLPFVRTRALWWNLDEMFPKYGELLHTDAYYIARNKLCLHSNRQGAVAEAILHEDVKTRIDPTHWIHALQGRQDAIDYIIDHNIKDCYQLEANYQKLRPFVKGMRRSI